MERTREDAHQQPYSRRLPAPSLPRPLSLSPSLSLSRSRSNGLGRLWSTGPRADIAMYSTPVLSNRKYRTTLLRDMGSDAMFIYSDAPEGMVWG